MASQYLVQKFQIYKAILKMRSLIIADTSVLIAFQKISGFDILKKLYDEISITSKIADEYREVLPEWIKIADISNKKYQTLLETQVDAGEASAIALAVENDDSLLVLDDIKARKLAKKLNLKLTGTLGILLKAKKVGIIKDVKPYIEKLLNTNFRISDNIITEILRLNNEIK